MRQARIGPVRTVAQGNVTRQALGRLSIETPGLGMADFTQAAAGFVAESGIADGLLTIFCRHTSASLIIQENADPDVRADILMMLDRLAPRNVPYRHRQEGPDDMPAHVRSLLTGVSLSIPILAGSLTLGTWQGLYLIEHRDAPHRREIVLHASGA